MAKQYQNVDVVDGQQRITTLIILYRAIINELDEHDPTEKQLKDDYVKMLMKDNATTLLLQNNDDTTRIFSDYVRNGTYKPTVDLPKTSAERNVVDAIRQCSEFVKEYKNNNPTRTYPKGFEPSSQATSNSLSNLIDHLNNNMLFVYQELEDESLAYYVFDALNNRGLDVAKFDLLKTNLMQLLFKDDNKVVIDEVHTRWSRIYRTIGMYNLESDILRFTATLYLKLKRPASEEKSRELLYDETQKGGGDAKAVLNTINHLETIAQALFEIEDNKLWSASNPKQPIKYVLVAIKISNVLSKEEKDSLCDLCLKTGFIAFTLGGVEAKNWLKEFVELACNVLHKKMPVDEIEKEIKNIAKQIDKKSSRIHEDIMKNVNDDDWYVMELHYLLYMYEEHLARKAGRAFEHKKLEIILKNSTQDTIEHIIPQSSKRLFVHYPGNLFLLPPMVNLKLSDKKPKEKKDEYRRTGFMMADEIIPHLTKWDKNAVIARGERIFKWACNEWDICKSEKK